MVLVIWCNAHISKVLAFFDLIYTIIAWFEIKQSEAFKVTTPAHLFIGCCWFKSSAELHSQKCTVFSHSHSLIPYAWAVCSFQCVCYFVVFQKVPSQCTQLVSLDNLHAYLCVFFHHCCKFHESLSMMLVFDLIFYLLFSIFISDGFTCYC